MRNLVADDLGITSVRYRLTFSKKFYDISAVIAERVRLLSTGFVDVFGQFPCLGHHGHTRDDGWHRQHKVAGGRSFFCHQAVNTPAKFDGTPGDGNRQCGCRWTYHWVVLLSVGNILLCSEVYRLNYNINSKL